MKINTTLVILIVALAGALGLLGKIAWDKNKLFSLNSQLNQELMQSKLEIGRAESKFGNAQDYVDELEEALKSEIDDRDALVTRYGKLRVRFTKLKKYKGKANVIYAGGEPIDIPDECPDLVEGYLYRVLPGNKLAHIEDLRGDYKDSALDASCRFYPNPAEDSSELAFFFNYSLHLLFDGEMVETITPSGAINNYFNMYQIDKDGKRIEKLKLEEFKVVIDDQRAPKFYWCAPHLDVGIFMGMRDTIELGMGGSLGISAMGYGLTKDDLSWRFLRVGIDLSNEPGLGIDPVQYNLGQLIPLVSNIWVSPHLMLTLDREWIVGMMIGAVL